MPCILCLESEANSALDIFSIEGKDLNVQKILMQHFWLEPREDDVCTFICRQCWNCVFEFHKFYSHIQRTHQEFTKKETKVFQDDLKSNKANEFKLEYTEKKELSHELLIEPTVKKRRTRQSKWEINDALEEALLDVKSSSVIEVPETDVLSNLKERNIHKSAEKKKNSRRIKKKTSKLETSKRRGRPKKEQTSKLKVNNDLKKLEQENDSTNEFYCADLKLEDEEIISQKTGKTGKLRRNLSHFDEFIKENIKLNCDLCKLPCETFAALLQHFRIEHKTLGYVICCEKKLLKRGVVVDHLYTHINPEYFKCADCGKVLADRRCLELHKQTHQDKGEKTFKCEICSKMFHLKNVYRRHVESHVPTELRKFECSQCAKKFPSKSVMNNHYRIVHLNKYSQVCDICGRKIHGREIFRLHQEQHKGVPQELINCDICGTAVKSRYDLKRHQKVKHSEEYQTPQECEYCSKISPNLSALNRHIYYMHGLERKHQCSMCNKAFKRPKDLKEHLSTHTGDVLYYCTYCPKTFNSNANMYAHRKRKHPKEWEQNHKGKSVNLNVEIKI